MDEQHATRLTELGDLVVAVGRQLGSAHNRSATGWAPAETVVVRFVERNPGTSAATAARALSVEPTNLSRTVRGLQAKGLVRREADVDDFRSPRLYLTPDAQQTLQRLRRDWAQAIAGIVDDPETIDLVNVTLRRLEDGLLAQRGSQ